MTAAEYLAELPEPVQVQLARIAKLALDLGPEERRDARAFFGVWQLNSALQAPDYLIPALQLFGPCGVIVALVDDEKLEVA